MTTSTETPPDAPPSNSTAHGAAFWFATGVGTAIMAVGAVEYLDATADFDRRANFVAFLIGADLAHDLVFAPLVCLVGWAARRACPARAWPPVRFGLIASGVLLLLALPGLRDTGAASGNPTIQPLDYASAFTTTIAVVWIIAALWLAALRVALRSGRSQKPGSPGQR